MELDSSLPVISDVDVILYDTFAAVQGDGVDLEDLVHGGDGRVVIFSWNLAGRAGAGAPRARCRRLPLEGAGRRAGRGRAIEAVHRGETVVPRESAAGRAPPDGEWPGREFGLSAREAEVLALITQGLSNQEIAERTYLSINSVKTYIRTAYRKIGVTRRAQAVAWGMRHGFEPRPGPQRGLSVVAPRCRPRRPRATLP